MNTQIAQNNNSVDDNCILCGSNNLKETIYSNIDGYKVFQCCECSLVFTGLKRESPLPEEINTMKYSGEDYIKEYLRFRYRREFVHRFKVFLYEIENLKDKGRILDIGCSVGIFLNLACKSGWDCTGIELSTTTADYAKDRFKLNVINKKLQDANFPGRYFDVVTMWDVLEHIPDPINELKEVHRILKDNGLLVVQVPNIESYKAIREGRMFIYLCIPAHLYHFSLLTIKKLLEKVNFKVIRITTFEPYDAMFDWLFPWMLKYFHSSSKVVRTGFVVIRKGMKLLFYCLYPILRPIQILVCRRNKGAEIQIYAQKKIAI